MYKLHVQVHGELILLKLVALCTTYVLNYYVDANWKVLFLSFFFFLHSHPRTKEGKDLFDPFNNINLLICIIWRFHNIIMLCILKY